MIQIKENNFRDKFKPKLNKTWIVHPQMEINIHICIYIPTKELKTLHSHTQRNKKYEWNLKPLQHIHKVPNIQNKMRDKVG